MLDWDALVETGAAPNRGGVTREPFAPPGARPAVEPPGGLEVEEVELGSPPALGASATDHVAASDLDLEPGTHVYRNLTILGGATWRCSGTTRIVVTEDCVVHGAIEASEADAPIRLDVGGDFVLGIAGRVENLFPRGALTIDVGGRASCGSSYYPDASGLRVGDGTLRIVARGAPGPLPSLSLTGAKLFAWQGVELLAEGDVLVSDADLESRAFGVAIASRSGAVGIRKGSRVRSSGPSGVAVEGALGTTVGEGSSLLAERGPVAVTAAGGDVVVDGGSTWLRSLTHDVTVAAAESVRLTGAVEVTADLGGLQVTAHGGDLVAGAFAALSCYAGPVELVAAHALSLRGDEPATPFGPTTVVECTAFTARAGGDVELGIWPLTATAGSIDVLAGGAIAGSGRLHAAAELRLVAAGGPVRLAEAELATLDADELPSGDVVVVAHGGPLGSEVDLRGAAVRTGGSAVRSGSVTLRAHFDAPPAAGGFLLPVEARLRHKRRPLGRSRLDMEGRLDAGAAGTLDGVPARLEVGAGTFELGTPVASGRGGRQRYRAQGALLRLRRAKDGRGREFRLRVRGAFLGPVQKDRTGEDAPVAESIALRFVAGLLDLHAQVETWDGAYRLDPALGVLHAPTGILVRADVVRDPAGPDAVDLLARVAPSAAPPELRFAFDGGNEVRVPAGAFVADGADFVAEAPAPGVDRVRFGAASGLLRVEASAVEAGDWPAPALDPPPRLVLVVDGIPSAHLAAPSR